jgi:RNA recognition motif-containing protein
LLATCIVFFILNFLVMNMYVSNLSFHTNEEALRTLFAAFGVVKSAKIITDRESGQSRGFGFVEMDVAAEAEAAMKNLNNKDIEGRALSVSVAREKAPRSDNKRW